MRISVVYRAGYIFYVVERAKKCLDFSATVYIVHLIICYTYGGWPASLTWWIVNVVGLAIMALLGEYLCIKRELRDIPISRYRPSKLFFSFIRELYVRIVSIDLLTPLRIALSM